ncbi:hypothetical protein LJK88_49620 [Paenibacillus sp. P26]|nr:hypothetical protein LJK88_49620 [Paenibacillus sp. P26]UUZ91497.1 hypothetical protein LJK87_38725 [Paenibacillus sp. P25]
MEQIIKWICSGERAEHTGLQELHGGRNNAVYLYTGNCGRLCIKRYKNNPCRRAEKEWAVLHYLKATRGQVYPEAYGVL